MPSPADRNVSVTTSRHPSAPAVASIRKAGAVGPFDVSDVVDPRNPGQVSEPPGTVVTGAAVVGTAVVVVLDDAWSPLPPEQAANPSAETARSAAAATEARARSVDIGAEA